MIYLIKFIFFIIITNSALSNENKTNKILFKINNKVYTDIDFENRKEYVAVINNFKSHEFNEQENKDILNDFISSLIFYEYYIQNKIVYKNLNDEIDLIFNKNFKKLEELNEVKINNYKFNTNIDLIRNKIIEKKLNLKKNTLLKEAHIIDLLYNYNLKYIILKENIIDNKLIDDIDDRNKFNNLKNLLTKNNIKFFYKEEDINNNTIVSSKIKNIINQNIPIYSNNEKGYVTLISIQKNLESYDGINVKLINFTSSKQLNKKDLQCDKLNDSIDIKKTIFKEYQYSKLNNNIKNSLKSINDYIFFNENNEYNYIVLCELKYDKNILKNINFDKNVNTLVSKIQKQFLKKYKNEYDFIKIK